MERYLELILKKRQYIQKLKIKLQNINQSIEKLKNQEQIYVQRQVNCYVKLNEYQMIEKESTIITYTFLFSFILFLLSGFSISIFKPTDISIIKLFLKILLFNVIQVSSVFMVVQFIRKYFQEKREQNHEKIIKVSEQIKELNDLRFHLFREQNLLQQEKKNLMELILKEEDSINDVSKIIMDTLLAFENKSLLPDFDSIIEEKLLLQDTPRRRTLNHFEK